MLRPGKQLHGRLETISIEFDDIFPLKVVIFLVSMFDWQMVSESHETEPGHMSNLVTADAGLKVYPLVDPSRHGSKSKLLDNCYETFVFFFNMYMYGTHRKTSVFLEN